MTQGYSILFEGAQATLLDLDHGTYPFVTSLRGRGRRRGHRLRRAADAHRRRPRRREGLLHAGGHRALPDRGARAPRPSGIRRAGRRVRRDHRAARAAAAGSTRWPCATPCASTASTRWPSRSSTSSTSSRRSRSAPATASRARPSRSCPADTSVLEACEPVYETLPGLEDEHRGVRDWALLPENARRYVERLGRAGRGRDRPRLDRPRPRADGHPRPQRPRQLVRLTPLARAVPCAGARDSRKPRGRPAPSSRATIDLTAPPRAPVAQR